jgi:SAM-dependent methyltransferase
MNHLSLDEQNLSLATSIANVDRINADFYGRFPFPWRPSRLEKFDDPDFQRIMLCQAIGDWQHVTIPQKFSIWVAGCGTNQAVITALNFPGAEVLGSDLSGPSLELERRIAEEVSVENLTVRQESLNVTEYQEEFDYILCTGVIHHNADPSEPLQRIAAALKPHGILELMVYNRFHRIWTSAFQKAIRILAGPGREPGGAVESEMARVLIEEFPGDCLMKDFLAGFREATEEQVADALMQPLEYSYTVESLHALATSCGLEMVAPCLCVFDRLKGNVSWGINFKQKAIRQKYLELSDVSRWHVANLLLGERSPMLWFYFRRLSAERQWQSERDICEQFLNSHFERVRTKKHAYVISAGNKYELAETSDYPLPPTDRVLAKIVASANASTPMREVLRQNGISTDFHNANQLRLRLTTPAYPYLKAVESKEYKRPPM